MSSQLPPKGVTQSETELLEAISKVSLFADLKDIPEATYALMKLLSIRIFKSGETIIREGESGAEFFILADGSASVSKTTQDGDQYKVAILHGHKGAFFGESALLEADTRSATIVADTECRCMVLTKSAFDTFSNNHPQWAMPIIRRVANAIMIRLKNMNNDLSLLYKALVDEFSHS